MSEYSRTGAVTQAQEIGEVSPNVRALTQSVKSRSYLQMAMRRFRRNKMAMTGLFVLLLMIVMALGADVIASQITHFEPQEQALLSAYAGIGESGYLLGADNLGRDTATRLVYGARVSLGVAGLAIIFAVTIGAAVGLAAGFYGGWVDSILMRFVDIMLSIPTLFLLLLITTLWRVGPVLLALVIAAVAWVTLSRLVRGEVMAVKNREYVEAARVVGVGDFRVMWRHILPNVAPVMIVWASLTVPALILVEAALSFLGLGVQPPTPSWGNMLSGARTFWAHSVTLVVLPGLAIYITVFAINLMGNGLRDALDPRVTD
jgi:ABC-type dipeptide/oligopeptide/nickel transport system permease subunit